jgi:hypothetical protein
MKTKPPYPPTPELDKMQGVKDRSQAIGEFLDWLQCEKGWELAYRHKHVKECLDGDGELTCGCDEGQFLPANYGMERLLAEHFAIDLNKVENERRAILEHLRQ